MASVRLLSTVTVISCLLLVCTAAGRLVSFTYIGCFIDNTGGARDLDGLKNIVQFGSRSVDPKGAVIESMSHELCSEICSLGGWRYFGAQYAAECFCANSHGSQEAGIESDCNKPCSGNAAQKCGGGNRNSVFEQTYLNENCPAKFIKAPRSNLVVSSSYSLPTHWNATASDLVECLFRCRAGCQAVIFSQQQRMCHLLKFALVPSELTDAAGEFFVRG